MTEVVTDTVVITRHPAQASQLEAGLGDHGVSVQFCPLTDFVLAEDPVPGQRLVAGLHAGVFAGVVVTSPNTVRALSLLGLDWARLAGGDTVVVATGAGTARKVGEHGYPGTVWTPTTEASAHGILTDLPGSRKLPVEPARPVALPQSAAATETLVTGLRGLGYRVDHVPIYHTVVYPGPAGRRLLAAPHPESAQRLVDLHALNPRTPVVLTASSAVRQLAERAGELPAPLAHYRLIALGRPTASTATELDITLAGTATAPNAAGILQILRNL
ncbi:uroporphyrinogen-III synthase [Auritidibacter ignavus]|uniref:uroporphyrinogen-III synthase n=1 Tax=Auritidibacter ignavus TaxID=678932 RepID=UPI0024B89F22|nr:uroporphyrinogen-III synthase [Auritidibacter ignavus]WHS28379.1 uroporphyrinogen-III synthase [Auritidibacter ignavus]